MKKIPYISMLFLIAACSDNGSHSYSYQYKDSSSFHPPLTTTPFTNAAAESNSEITGMISRNDQQVSAYIDYMVGEWTPSADSATLDNLDIANMALWLTDGEKSATDIEAEFEKNPDLMRTAMYAISHSLGKCKDGDAATTAKCFTDWREKYSSIFNTAAKTLRQNAQELVISNAEFNATDGAQIKFTVDETGKITAVDVINGEETKTYNSIYKNQFLGNLEILTYDSQGKEMGLSYSDFGTYEIQTNTTEKTVDNVPFAGGYASKQIAPEKITENMTFTGDAIGTVHSTRDGYEKTMNVDGNAWLKFDTTSGTSDLNAYFTHWYNVYAQTGPNGTTVQFDGDEGDELNIRQDMQLITALSADSDKRTADSAEMTVNYYGATPENGIPTEAVGTLTAKDCGGLSCDGSNPAVWIDMAFGFKKN